MAHGSVVDLYGRRGTLHSNSQLLAIRMALAIYGLVRLAQLFSNFFPLMFWDLVRSNVLALSVSPKNSEKIYTIPELGDCTKEARSFLI